MAVYLWLQWMQLVQVPLGGCGAALNVSAVLSVCEDLCVWAVSQIDQESAE